MRNVLLVLGFTLLSTSQSFAEYFSRKSTFVDAPLEDCLLAAEMGVLHKSSPSYLDKFSAIHDGKYYMFDVNDGFFYCAVLVEQ
jgi:hypothetical protein